MNVFVKVPHLFRLNLSSVQYSVEFFRIHKELNEIIGKKQLELHVQVPPLTKGPLVPSPHNMNGVKPGTPQAGGMTKAAVGSRSGGSTPQGRTGTRA